MLYLPIAVLVGAIVPVQTAANSRLRAAVGNRPIVSALISFTVALAVSMVMTLVLQGSVLPSFSTAPPPWWGWLGGVGGVAFVIGNILLFPRLGPVLTVVLPILGQVVMGLLIDQFGLFRSPQIDVGVLRVLGALVVLGGILLVMRVGIGGAPRAGAGSGGAPRAGAPSNPEDWLYRGLGVAVGMGSACQTAINGYMGTIAGSSLHAAEINLFVGAVLLLGAVLVTSPRQLTRAPEPGPWWMWLGGFVGAVFVVSGATLAPLMGTATTVIAFNAGTIAGGQIMESLGAFGARRNPLNARRLLGLALIFAGVVMVRLL